MVLWNFKDCQFQFFNYLQNQRTILCIFWRLIGEWAYTQVDNQWVSVPNSKNRLTLLYSTILAWSLTPTPHHPKHRYWLMPMTPHYPSQIETKFFQVLQCCGNLTWVFWSKSELSLRLMNKIFFLKKLLAYSVLQANKSPGAKRIHYNTQNFISLFTVFFLATLLLQEGGGVAWRQQLLWVW